MVCLCPLFYLPHVCLQQILYVLDHDMDRHSAIAFAALLVLSHVAITVFRLQQMNV